VVVNIWVRSKGVLAGGLKVSRPRPAPNQLAWHEER
jgi:hypothetical protein